LQGWARRIDRGQTNVALKPICLRTGQVPDIDASAGAVVHRDLHSGIPRNKVTTDDVSLDSRNQYDPVRISYDCVVLDHVVITTRSDNTNPEVVSLGRKTIPTSPVRTEPVATSATGQSYTSAWVVEVSVSYGDVVFDQVLGSAADEDTGAAVRGHRHARHSHASTAENPYAFEPKSLDQTRSSNDHVFLCVDINPKFPCHLHSATARLRVAQAGYAESVQIQRHAGCAQGYTRRAANRAGYVTNELAVSREGERRCNGTTDVRGVGAPGVCKER
jgi:hypothetical protein